MIRHDQTVCELNHRLRVVAGPCRSGTTAIGNGFSQHPKVEAYYQSVKTGLRDGEGECHKLFFQPAGKPASKKFLVDKETFGPHTPAESAFRLFPNDEAIVATRPIFLYRDPVSTWNSWMEQGWTRYDLFELAYVSVFQTYRYAQQVAGHAVSCMTYETLVDQPLKTMRAMCSHWRIPFDESLVQWKTKFQPNTSMRGGKDFLKSKDDGSFRAVEESTTIRRLDRPLVISTADIEKIQSGPLWAMYKTIQREGFGFVGAKRSRDNAAESPP